LAGRTAGDAAEYCSRHQPSAPWIVEVEQTTDKFTRSIKTWNWLQIDVQHLAEVIDAQTAKRESDSTTDLIGVIRRLVDCVRPIGLIDQETLCAPPVLDI